MNVFEYFTLDEQNTTQYRQKRHSFMMEYLQSISKYDKGDIITNGIITIEIDEIDGDYKRGFAPTGLYIGFLVKKNFARYKRNTKGIIYFNTKINLLRRIVVL